MYRLRKHCQIGLRDSDFPDVNARRGVVLLAPPISYPTAALSPCFAIATLGLPMTRQRMGQHFLSDPGWQARILGALPRSENEVWVEIGAGHGEMTRLLAARAARVIAIEADPRLADEMRARARAHPEEWRGVEIVEGDVLGMNLSSLGGARFRVYGSLPYYITAPILRRLFLFAEGISSIHVVIQHEVAARIVARPGSRTYGYLSALCQYYARPEMALRIPPGAFRPPPRVISALVNMRLPGERVRLKVENEQEFLDFVAACFEKKRKTLRNNLRARYPDGRIEAALEACGLPPDARAEQLSLGQFAALLSCCEKSASRPGQSEATEPRSQPAGGRGNPS